MIDDDIAAFYNRGLEQARLQDPRRSVEFWRTIDILHRHLPPPPATVLDIGGGPGIYALHLTGLGYQVTLVDPVPLHLDQARAASDDTHPPIHRILAGTAGDLPTNQQFDAVLLLGPLYHLTGGRERAQAWSEARRVTRPGGVIVAAAASRYYAYWEALTAGKLTFPGAVQSLTVQLHTGIYRPPGGSTDDRLWTTAYFHDPDELATEARTADLVLRTLIGVEGPTKLLADISMRMGDLGLRQELLDIQCLLEEEPSLLGLSQHILAIADRTDQE